MKFIQNYLKLVSDLSRKSKISLQIITDISIALLCFALAIFLEGESLTLFTNPITFLGMSIAIIAGSITFAGLGLYRLLIRFVTGDVLMIITKGVVVSASTFALFIIIADLNIQLTFAVIYALLLFLSTGSIRFIFRRLLLNSYQIDKKKAAIYGAGKAGRELQNLLFHNHEIQPFAFIDDDPSIQGLTIGGSRVYSYSSFEKIVKKYEVKLILLALPTISRKRRRQIIEKFQGYNIEIKSIPPLSKILTGQAMVSELRPVTPEMLLGRDPISPVQSLMQRNITNRSVMITGAGGSIGSELSRQVLMQNPTKIVLFELSELALYQINEELITIIKQTKKPTKIVPVLGSVCDKKRVSETVKVNGVNSIYHCAAYKHVPLVEENIIEGIKNNVFGTLVTAETAMELNVNSFTLISTDKAVRPTNVMGASKRIAELICQAHSKESLKTKFSMVRFGNVLGSSGSVIPLFQKQIDAGGPVTITHPEVTRYFMTIPEAAQLVIQASAMTKGGDVFVLDMGEPVKIADLAADVIRFAGYKPYLLDHSNQIKPEVGQIPISVIGLRNGEKLYEELLVGNNSQGTEHPRIMKANEMSLSMKDITRHLKRLRTACEAYDVVSILKILDELPLEFNRQKQPSNNRSISTKTKTVKRKKGLQT